MRTHLMFGALAVAALGCGGDGAADDAGSAPRDSGLAPIDAAIPPGVDGGPAIDAALGDAAVDDAGMGVDASHPPASGVWVLGYFPGYQRDLLPAEEIDFTSMTHLVVGAAIPRADGTLETSFDLDPTNGPAFARDLATRAHAAGREAILMLGGAGAHDGFAAAAAPGTRDVFVASILATMDELGFDGVDVDWEPIPPEDEADFEALVHALRLARPGMRITIPVGWANANFPDVGAVYGRVAADADRLNVMSYDMAGPWDGWQSWYTSALDGESPTTPSSIDTSVTAYLAAGVPAAKLGIGVGFYGDCWTGVSGPRMSTAGASLVASDNTMSFEHIVGAYYASLTDPGAAYHYDAETEQPYLSFAAPHGPEGCTFVSYEDPASIAAKGAYVRSHGLGGAIIWAIPEGHVRAAPAGMRDPLLAAMRTAFLE
ncbi:MAG: glycoside hydrolase family 18 protein [Sandaracinaceae bacterium]|nr:glycoside hydrolase family 18 protein [Sandaracinaceae bacterium]